MADIMVTFAHDFATKWEMEAFVRQDMKGFEAIKDQLVALGMTDAKHGILFGQKDKHRTIAVLRAPGIDVNPPSIRTGNAFNAIKDKEN